LIFSISKGIYSNGELMNWIDGHADEAVMKIISLYEIHLAIGYKSSNNRTAKSIRILNWKTGGQFGKLIGHTARHLDRKKYQSLRSVSVLRPMTGPRPTLELNYRSSDRD